MPRVLQGLSMVHPLICKLQILSLKVWLLEPSSSSADETGIHWVGYSEHDLQVMGGGQFQHMTPMVTLVLVGRARTELPNLMSWTPSFYVTVFYLSKYPSSCDSTVLWDQGKLESS